MRDHHHEPCGTGCATVPTQRNRYYTGKYLTARDFALDPDYLLGRHRLHNRLLHGWGVVCGLTVERHPKPACAERWVVVRGGVALDCCGREIVLCPDRTPFELPLPAAGADPEAVRDSPFLLAVRYRECAVECTPVLYAEGACDPARTEANRIREDAELVVVDWDPRCWPDPERGEDAVPECRDDCDDEPGGPGGACLEPDCPCGEVVPLALVIPEEDEDGHWGFRLEFGGRRRQPPPASMLTHIVRTNWRHGSRIGVDELVEDMGGRLEVTFDRRLAEATQGTGIGPFTFVVQFADVQQALEFVPSAQDPFVEDDCRAVFEIAPYVLQPGRRSIAGSLVLVTLKCDFIVDCRGWPVDGDHLRGALPTGDGVMGGTFESWFEVDDQGSTAR